MQELTRQTDLELIQGFRNGNRNNLGELFRRYLSQAYGVALHYLRDPAESEDAVMQVFEKLHKDLLHHEVRFFKSWLHTVVRNHCLMELRKKKGRFSVPIDIAQNRKDFVESAASNHQEEALSGEDNLQLLEQGIQTLNNEQKTCIELFYIQQQSYKEIAGQTGFTLLQIKSYIQNGKRNLRIFLDKKK